MNKTAIHQHKKLLLSGRVLVTEWFPCMFPGTCSNGTILRLKKNSLQKYFSITKGCYSSVNSILQSMCDNLCSSGGWDISQLPRSWDICKASQLLHLKFNTTSNEENKKIRLKAVSEDLKNIVGLEHLVDCSQTKNDSKEPQGSHDLEVPQYCKKTKKKLKDAAK